MSKPIWTAERAVRVLADVQGREGYLAAPILNRDLVPLLKAFLALDAIDRITHQHIDREALVSEKSGSGGAPAIFTGQSSDPQILKAFTEKIASNELEALDNLDPDWRKKIQ